MAEAVATALLVFALLVFVEDADEDVEDACRRTRVEDVVEGSAEKTLQIVCLAFLGRETKKKKKQKQKRHGFDGYVHVRVTPVHLVPVQRPVAVDPRIGVRGIERLVRPGEVVLRTGQAVGVYYRF